MKAKTKWTKLLLAVLLVVVLAVCATACSKTFTVTFDSNGGSAVGSVEVKSNGTVEEPNAPTRTGYTFENGLSRTEPSLFSERTRLRET